MRAQNDDEYGFVQTMQWLKSKPGIRYIIKGSGPRDELWEIPETVFKEILINSLSHRDYYDKGARTTVDLFSDRVEISNPGGLVSAISPQDFGKRSLSRNPLIFGLFDRMHMVEQIGSGIGKIFDLMSKSKLPSAEFSYDGMFTVTLRRRQLPGKAVGETVGQTVGETSTKILAALEENPYITRTQLSEFTGLSVRGVEYQLNLLKKANRIELVGANKKDYWKVL